MRNIAALPALVEEARAALPVLEAVAKAPAGKDGVRAVIGKRFALFPQPERSDGEWSAWWADYHDALAEIPLGSLEAAMGAYVRQADAEFMPKPGILAHLAKTVPNRSIQAFTRAQAAIKASEALTARLNAPQTIDPPRLREIASVSDRAAVQRMRDAYVAQVEERPKRVAPLGPPTHGPTDDGGLTPQMRAWLAENGGAPS